MRIRRNVVLALVLGTAALALCGPLAPGAGTSATEASGTVRFLAPRHLAPVLGVTVIELRVDPPAGAQVVRVVVQVDGAEIAVMTSPPWKASWDAGEASTGHLLGATASFSDGSRASASTRTSALRVQEFDEVSLVSFYATVQDDSGDYVMGLGPGDFLLTEDGRPQRIELCSTERKPLRLALVLDNSLSMDEMKGAKLLAAQAASLRFLDVLEPGDEAMVVTFSDDVRVAQEMTSDRKALAAAIQRVRPVGGTALYDAIWRTSDLLAGHDGRRVLLLLSDGRDEARSGLEPGSLHTLGEAMDRAIRSEVMLFAIGVGDFGTEKHPLMDFEGRRPLRSILQDLGSTTGGQVLFLTRPKQLYDAFADVAEALRNQYAIAYTSDDPRRNGTWRHTRLFTSRPGLTVTARRGYYAPKPPALDERVVPSG